MFIMVALNANDLGTGLWNIPCDNLLHCSTAAAPNLQKLTAAPPAVDMLADFDCSWYAISWFTASICYQ